MKKVYIGVGHGGKDSGAVANGFLEKDLNLSIALHCTNELIKNGAEVKISREDDRDSTIQSKTTQSNAFLPDVSLDIHNNAGGGNGFEVYHKAKCEKSKKLALEIENEVKAIGQNSRGLKTKTQSNGAEYFGFLRENNSPAVIVECAFMDSSDISTVDTEEKRKSMGQAIARGVLKTLNITPTKTDKLFRVQVGAYQEESNAEAMAKELKEKGYQVMIK